MVRKNVTFTTTDVTRNELLLSREKRGNPWTKPAIIAKTTVEVSVISSKELHRTVPVRPLS